ncbi:MAG TPA: hypothetical protein VL358_01685 [Caulobacteraceae bacterium]|jgi:hypothetical protein|nr:hypothetical protein [Caulobacteraceae bacterium]
MALDALLFVSKRLQPVAAALICLALAQVVLASCTPEPLPMGAWRAAISH